MTERGKRGAVQSGTIDVGRDDSRLREPLEDIPKVEVAPELKPEIIEPPEKKRLDPIDVLVTWLDMMGPSTINEVVTTLGKRLGLDRYEMIRLVRADKNEYIKIIKIESGGHHYIGLDLTRAGFLRGVHLRIRKPRP